MRILGGVILGIIFLSPISAVCSADDEQPSVPPGLKPFEQIVGGWKGQGIPPRNRLKGWPERHSWAWKFVNGKPVALTVETTKGKILSTGVLTNDPKSGVFHLEGTDPEGKPVAYEGKMDDSVGTLSLDRIKPPAEVGEERLDLALSSTKIRYSMRLFRKEPGAPQYALVIDANLGKEGESFAAGGSAADLPRCIVTGGAGTMTVSYQGKSFPICCSGCRDEFNDSPDKYMKKYLARNNGTAPPAASSSTQPSTDADSRTPAPDKPPTQEMTDSEKPSKPEPASADEINRKANGILLQAQALEKLGKTQAAIIYFKRIVKDFPDSPSAVTARARIKALGG